MKDDGSCIAKCDPATCLSGNTCVGNVCVLKCNSHLTCSDAQRCLPAVEDGTQAVISTCQAADLRGIGAPCPFSSECTTGMVCSGNGVGDAQAFCTTACNADAECPGGFECGVTRDPRSICSTTKGNNKLCGRSTEPCVERSLITPGSGLVEGEFCLQRKLCLKRNACSTCSSDVDCSLVSGQECVAGDGGLGCAATCKDTSDCTWDKTCVAGHCLGACEGTGGFCSPCRDDLDCAPTFACTSLFGAPKTCVDPTYSATCTTSEDCPVAPSGLHGACYNAELGGSPGDAFWQHCFPPYTPSSNVFSCYRAR